MSFLSNTVLAKVALLVPAILILGIAATVAIDFMEREPPGCSPAALVSIGVSAFGVVWGIAWLPYGSRATRGAVSHTVVMGAVALYGVVVLVVFRAQGNVVLRLALGAIIGICLYDVVRSWRRLFSEEREGPRSSRPTPMLYVFLVYAMACIVMIVVAIVSSLAYISSI